MAAKSQFYGKTVQACAQRDLAEKLYRATYRQFDGRREMCAELGDSDHFRQLAADVRDDVLRNLDTHLGTLIGNLEQAGVSVHWAADSDQAREIICRVARDNDVSRVVKSKSMVTEEIELNDALERAGVDVTETDLGEYIIQLAGQKPGHLVTPAIHCSTEDVAEIFRKHIGYTGPTEPTALTKAARKVLRDKFKSAQMGISGVNFAVADPGLITICTNEGNGRYVTTMPKVYLAVMGMERVVGDLHAAAVMLKMLGRFSTGQRITQYTNMIHGPVPGDGPQQMHLVILDNGRSKILGGKYWQMLRCIRCGACLNACPVFKHIGGHCFPGCYSGPMGTVLLPLLKGLENMPDVPKASSLCQACNEACPVKIPLADFILELRSETAGWGAGGLIEKLAMSIGAFGMSQPLLYRLGKLAARWAMKPISKSGWVRWLPGPPGRWTAVKNMPVPARKSFLAEMRETEAQLDSCDDGERDK